MFVSDVYDLGNCACARSVSPPRLCTTEGVRPAGRTVALPSRHRRLAACHPGPPTDHPRPAPFACHRFRLMPWTPRACPQSHHRGRHRPRRRATCCAPGAGAWPSNCLGPPGATAGARWRERLLTRAVFNATSLACLDAPARRPGGSGLPLERALPRWPTNAEDERQRHLVLAACAPR